MTDNGHRKGILRVRIELLDIQPAIWREIEVPAAYTFWDLHVAIQDAMGWLDYHLHAFRFRDREAREPTSIGIPLEEGFAGDRPVIPGWDVPVVAHLDDLARAMEYEYDFGDGWRHRVELLEAKFDVVDSDLPRCIAGARACPPEDCGGPWGYQSLLEALADSTNEDHDEMLEWVGGTFDSEHFDTAEIKFDDPRERWQRAFGNGEPG